jgi:hypothetical protein
MDFVGNYIADYKSKLTKEIRVLSIEDIGVKSLILNPPSFPRRRESRFLLPQSLPL